METHSGEKSRILVCGTEEDTEEIYITVRTHSGEKSCNAYPPVWLRGGYRVDGREPATMNIGES